MAFVFDEPWNNIDLDFIKSNLKTENEQSEENFKEKIQNYVTWTERTNIIWIYIEIDWSRNRITV